MKINFPKDFFDEDIFLETLKREWQEEPEGMFVVQDTSSAPPRDVGFLWLNTKFSPHRKAKFGDVHYVHLIPEYRGRGVGRLLMQKADEYFGSKGVKTLRLGTAASYSASIKLYEKCGYQRTRVIFEKEL